MKYQIVVSVAVVIVTVFSTNFCVGSKHAYGNRNADFIVKLSERKLIDDSDNDVPKDYTIIFKFHGTTFQPILYIEIDVNKESSGDMKGSEGVQNRLYSGHPPTDYDATIYVKNATHVTANLTIYTFDLPQYRRGLSKYSATYIYVKNTTSTEKPYAQNSIGKRRKGDELIYFESRNVTKTSSFPSSVFEYSGCDHFTYAGFSFNSPTAMVLVNTSIVTQQQFNAVVYDMNAEHFVANMAIYGFKSRGGQQLFWP